MVLTGAIKLITIPFTAVHIQEIENQEEVMPSRISIPVGWIHFSLNHIFRMLTCPYIKKNQPLRLKSKFFYHIRGAQQNQFKMRALISNLIIPNLYGYHN